MVRMHVVLPQDLDRSVDALAGKQKRSRFIEKAIRDKLRREAVLVETAGGYRIKNTPGPTARLLGETVPGSER